MHTRAVLIPLIQLTAMTKLKRGSDYNISFVQNSCRPREMIWEDVSPQFFFVSSSDVTLTWQSTKKKIHQRSWSRSFASRKSVKEMYFRQCYDSRNIWTRSYRHHENDFWTQSWYPNDELQQNYVSYRESVVDDSWRSAVFEMSQTDTTSTMDCSDCLRKCVLSIISSVMYVENILNWMNIQTRIRRWWDTRKYSNVIKKVCIDLNARPDFDLQDDDWYEGRIHSARRLNEYFQTSTEDKNCIHRRHGAAGDYGRRTRGNWV